MSTRPSLEAIENAFQPAREILDSSRFAGRKQFVSDAHRALLTRGANIAVIGNRGIGKTSFARQLLAMASGDTSLLEKLSIAHDRKLDFLTAYYACGDSTGTHSDLLQRLLTTDGCLADWVGKIEHVKKEVSEHVSRFTAGSFTVSERTSTEATRQREPTERSVGTVFSNAIAAIARQGVAGDGVLIVIDEFDQIKDPSGFAGFLKSIATNCPAVKFCLVGVARDLQRLMQEHESADRLFAGGVIALPPMSKAELHEIVLIAQSAIGDYVQFDESAVDELVRLAQGHPYMVHLLGKYALRLSHERDIRMIDRGAIQATLRTIAERAADPLLEGRYKKAIASSAHRETVLKAMALAQTAEAEIHTTDAYKTALDAGVDNASQYVGHLVTAEYGAELEKVRDRFYRFKDSLFHAYVCARPRVFGPV